MTYANRKITVFGLHRSGVAVAKLLDDLGAEVRVTDPKPADELQSDIDRLANRSIRLLLDGHDRRCIDGTNLIVVSPGVPLDIPILQEARAMRIPIVGELEIAASVCPAPIVAITGTKGKSTTTILVSEMLKRGNFRRVCPAGNIGVPLSSIVQSLTAEDLVVAEVSSFQLETTVTFRPTVSAVLNLSRDHLDRHQTMAAYRAAKLKICKNQQSTDWIVLNATDAAVGDFAAETGARAVYFTDQDTHTFTDERMRGAYIQGDGICVNWAATPQRVCEISDLPLPGRHNLQNVLAAIAIGRTFNLSSDIMRAAIREFSPARYPPLAHAFEPVKTIVGVRFINDSKATNVAAVKAALESLSEPILLIMGGYDKGNDYQPLIELVRSKVKGLILLGAHTRLIRNALASQVVTWDAARMSDAVKIAYSHATWGDVILLSPANASFDMFTDYKHRGQAFREAVVQLES